MEINWLAVLAASLVGFVVGAIWYGPVFGKVWMGLVGLTEEDAGKVNMAKVYGICFVLQLIMAINLAMFLGTEINAGMGAAYGFATGFGWVALAFAINALFEQKPLKYMLINGGYWSIVFTLMGLIIGAWH
jgi:hypothetical protein